MNLRRALLVTAAITGMIVAAPTPAAAAACGLDTSFGNNGILTVQNFNYGRAITVDAQGRYVMAGGANGMIVTRMLPTGELDTSFGDGRGYVYVPGANGYNSEAYDMIELADGRIAVAGRSWWAVSPTSWGDIAVVVLNPDGSRDTGFGGGDGVAYLDLDDHNDIAQSIDVDARGRFVLGGSTGGSWGVSTPMLARLLPDGTPDRTFGTDGFVVRSFGGSYETVDDVGALPDGAILAAGSWQSDSIHPWLGRFRDDGMLDPSFGQEGLVQPGVYGSWHDIAAGPRGTILVGGDEGASLVVSRYTANGDVDRSYGAGDGKALVSFPGEWDPWPSAYGLAVLNDGSVLAVGAAWRTQYTEGVIARFNRAGLVDRTFGTDGVVRYSEDPQYSASLFNAAAALPGGGAVAVGAGYSSAIVARTC